MRIDGVPIKGSPPMKRKSKQGSPAPDGAQLSSPFLNWRQNDPITADRVSPLFVSLVSLVRDNVPFHDSLLLKVTTFFSMLDPASNDLSLFVKDFKKKPGQNTTDAVPLFLDSIAVLLSSSHASILLAVLAYLHRYLASCSAPIQLNLLNSNLISIILSTHCLKDLSALDDQLILTDLIPILKLFSPTSSISGMMLQLLASSHADGESIQDLMLQKVLIQMEPSLVQISRNPHLQLWGKECFEITGLLSIICEASAFYQPTLEFLCSSRIPIVIQPLLTEVENEEALQHFLLTFALFINRLKTDGAEVMHRGKILQRMLAREGFRDGLELTRLQHQSTIKSKFLRWHSFEIMVQLGMNSPKPR
ncbi:hypothetical protein BLNAU_17200 [Blattamonas nauphoetae]|uniref:Uncharacterized protein n=1 Tax=Blattamonas nauphoetae TaxID=2049346 RepID=A0ABQ9XCE3_9EUKA|nr:hypothetical protein BLNAU_17200 [Blattamonas nauphoetae]